MTGLGLTFGLLVGLALGLTGGGGSLLAVPMLVYGLGVSPASAVGASLAAVGAVSAVGAVQRWRLGQLEAGVGLLFAAGGVVGAPLGGWLGRRIPPSVLMLAFAALMLFIAVRMWRQATHDPKAVPTVRADARPPADDASPACAFEPEGRLRLTSRCGVRLVAAGLGAGVLSGLFGVGGGFVIVPALVLLTRVSVHRAVATSLMVISIVSAAGIASFYLGGGVLPVAVTALFAGGGVVGMAVGTAVARRLAPATLQRFFSAAIVAVAVFVVAKTTVLP